jgi:hypothetical protein
MTLRFDFHADFIESNAKAARASSFQHQGLSRVSDCVTRTDEEATTENGREEAHDDCRARRVHIARVRRIARVNVELQVFALLRVQ